MRRKICWPNPDSVCLEGGCSYCNGGEWKTHTEILSYINSLENSHEMWAKYFSGRENRFYNRVEMRGYR